MAQGLSVTVANAILDALCRSVAWTEPVAFYVKLHTGAPGSAGTANAAANTTRKLVAFSAAALGAITNSGAITWTNVPNTETYTHISFWDAVTAGTFLGSDQLDAPHPVTAGNDATIAVGDLDLSLSPLAS